MPLQYESLPVGVLINGLTGGGSTKLDGIPTAGSGGLTQGTYVLVHNGSNIAIYELKQGTDSELPPSRIRPDDYATAINEKIWHLCAFTSNGYFFSASGDPGVPLNIDGRAQFIHGLTMQGGSQNFTNNSDHFHLIWTQQNNRGWQMIMGGDNSSTNNRFMLGSLSNGLTQNLYNEANAHSIDTSSVNVGIEPEYKATGIKLKYTTNPALPVDTLIALSLFPGLVGITAATYSGKVTQAPTLSGSLYEVTVALDNFSPANWDFSAKGIQPVFLNSNNVNCFRLNSYPEGLSGTRVSLTGNYEDISFQVLVDQTGHNAFLGQSIVLQITSTVIALAEGFYDGYVDRILNPNQFVIRLGSMIHSGTIYPSTSGTTGSSSWLVISGNQDPVHRMLSSLQSFMFERRPTGNTSESTNGRVFRYGIGPNCIGLSVDAAAIGFDILNNNSNSIEIGAENLRKLRISKKTLSVAGGLSIESEYAARVIHDAASVLISSNKLTVSNSANIIYATGSGPINEIANASGVCWLINNTGTGLTITNSLSIICRGGANMTLAAGEGCTFIAGNGFVSVF
jgi:hypothetical protein